MLDVSAPRVWRRRAGFALGVAVLFASLVTALVARAKDKPDQNELDQLLAETDQIAEKVAKMRGLALKKPIQRGILSRAQIEKRVLDVLSQDTSDAELAADARAAKRLGLMPLDVDFKGLFVALLTEQIAGFYDLTVKELYLADWIAPAEQRMVMAHEIAHALQDQHFDLVKFTKASKDNGDAQLARQALCEGDGVAIMVEFSFAEMKVKLDPWVDDTIVDGFGDTSSDPGAPLLAKAPLFLREGLLFPYAEGLRFVASVRRHNPWSRVDEIYKKPPASTEHIMHPEKYFAAEAPVVVKMPAWPTLKTWKTVSSNVLGEWGMGSWLRTHGVAADRSRDAAAGWGGDRYTLYAPPGDDGQSVDTTVLVALIAWDTEIDAGEGFAAAREALIALAGGRRPSSESADQLAVWESGGQRTLLERKGKKLALVIGVPKDLGDKLRKDVWAKWK
jgi:hypothetical protein